MTMGEEMRRGYNDFSLRMSSSLFRRWMCCVVENIFRVFLSKWTLILLWIMRVYIVWVKGKKVTLKIIQAERFASILPDGLTCETLTKSTAQHDSSASSMCFSCAIFPGTFLTNFLRASCEIAMILYFMLILFYYYFYSQKSMK